jgi:hypothetical protein
MAEPVSPLIAFSDHVAGLVERASVSIVAVHGGGRWSSSGIHWRPGVIVTAEEILSHAVGLWAWFETRRPRPSRQRLIKMPQSMGKIVQHESCGRRARGRCCR